jgi:outer membrane receptor protein involved in Fe transport
MALTRKTLLQSTFYVLTFTGLASGAAPALAQTAPANPSTEANLGAGTLNLSLPDVTVVAQKLDAARSAIEPSLGATKYNFTRKSLATIPQAGNAPLNQVLLQAPGVAQDSFGQIHVRGDHNEVQYRLDGVELPEGLSVFGQTLESHFADSMSLITGALPAQYGFLQAGVVDITTKSGATDPGGEISMEGGSRGYLEPTFSYGGTSGRLSYYFTGDYLKNPVGIENTTGSSNALHDVSTQYHDMAHLDYILDPTTRISLIVGISNEEFQIPNNPNQPTYTLPNGQGINVKGITTFNSSDLNEYQREITDFGILSLQKHYDTIDLQISAYTRYSSLNYTPDPIGDLLFNGIAQTADRSIWSNGVQSDGSWRINATHTLRAGFQFETDATNVSTASSVLQLNAAGAQISNQPVTIYQGSQKTGTLYGFYLQDEWKILPRVTINYGARFDGVNEYTSAVQLSPRVNVVWTPTDTTTLHAGYSRYFTPPPFELVGPSSVSAFANTTGAALSTQDTTVKAERDNYYDAGITQILMPGLQVGLDAYFKQATDLIDEGQFGAPNILTAYNYTQGQDSGVELSGSYDRGPWSIYGNIAYSRAIGKGINTAQFNFPADTLAYSSQHWIYLDHDQRWTGSGGIAYTVNRNTRNATLLSADLVYGSGLRTDAMTDAGTIPNGMEVPGYYTVNGSIVQQLNFRNWHGASVRLDVINLFDRTYALREGGGIGVYAPQYGERRTILVGVSQKF